MASLYSSRRVGLLYGRHCRDDCKLRRMPSDFRIEKLSDEFGQYALILTCACGHARKTTHTSSAGAALRIGRET